MRSRKRIILTVSAIIVLVVVSFILLRKYHFFASEISGKLVLSYNFQTITDGKVIDGSGNAPSLDGTMHGGTIVDVGGAPALQLNGTSDYVEVPSSDLLNSNSTNEMSYEISFKSDNYSAQQVLISRREPCNNDGHFKLYSQNSQIFFSYYSDIDKKSDTISSDRILENGKSYKIYFLKKWNAIGAKLYINGVQAHLSGEDSVSATTYTNLPTFVGAQNGDGNTCGHGLVPNYFFKGTISDVKIWNKFLTEAEIEGLSTSQETVITSGKIKLAIDNFGYIRSLKSNDVELLSDNGSRPIGNLITKGGASIPAVSFTAAPGDIYNIGYPGSDIITQIKISPETTDRLIFSLIGQSGSAADIESVNLFDFSNAKHIAQSSDETAWAKSAAATEPFIVSLPLNNSTVCAANYTCYGASVLGLANAQAALIVTPKSNYLRAIEKLIDDKNLPKVMTDGQWFRTDPGIGDDYLFVDLNSTNAASLVDQAQKGGFKEVIFTDPLIHGHYDQPSARTGYSSQEDLYNAIDQFSNNGIKVGIHSFIGRVDPKDSFFKPPSQNLQKVAVGTITSALSASTSDTAIITGEDIAQNTDYKYYSTAFFGTTTTNYFLVDDEIMQCTIPVPQTSPPKLNCNRRYSNWTSSASHSAGSSIYMLPESNGFFINYENKAVFDQSVASFKAMAERLNVNFFYFDGFGGLPATTNSLTKLAYSEKNTLLPYLTALTNKPTFQSGASPSSFSYYYSKRFASWDGAEFQPKNFTRDSKVAETLTGTQNPYSPSHPEIGWWKFLGAEFNKTGSGSSQSQYDLQATTLDDIYYAMTKVVAFSSSLGLELGIFSNKLNGLDALYGIINRYEGLIAKQKAGPFIPQNILDYLKQSDHEAALINTAGYQFIERQVFDQFITPETKTFNVDNKFGGQKLKISIRPQPDFKGFDDSGNTLMTDFHDATVVGSSSDRFVRCTILNGQVTIVNSSTTALGSCKINVPGAFNLANKRGVGLQMTGDGKNELVIVDLSNDFRKRDFSATVDFSGSKTLTLGNPTTNLSDKIDDLSTKFGVSVFRSWNFNYASSNITAQIIIHTKPSGTYSVTLNSLKALAEKDSSTLKNPAIEIGGKKITFPVSLSYDDTDPNILEYDGYSKTYKLYNSNYGSLGDGIINDDNIEVANGSNQVAFSSDEGASYSQRANLKVTVNDDEDNDGVPTHGSYSAGSQPCKTLGDNFCDDNRPTFYNPKQNLSPIIESVNVADGQVIAQNPYIVSAKVSDVSQIAKVEFYVDNNLIGTSTLPDVSGFYDATWDTSKYHSTVKVIAYDTTGSTTEISRTPSVQVSGGNTGNDQIVDVLPKTGEKSWYSSILKRVSDYLQAIFH